MVRTTISHSYCSYPTEWALSWGPYPTSDFTSNCIIAELVKAMTQLVHQRLKQLEATSAKQPQGHTQRSATMYGWNTTTCAGATHLVDLQSQCSQNFFTTHYRPDLWLQSVHDLFIPRYTLFSMFICARPFEQQFVFYFVWFPRMWSFLFWYAYSYIVNIRAAAAQLCVVLFGLTNRKLFKKSSDTPRSKISKLHLKVPPIFLP